MALNYNNFYGPRYTLHGGRPINEVIPTTHTYNPNQTYWSKVGVNIAGSSVKQGSKFWSSLSSSSGGINGAWHCLRSN